MLRFVKKYLSALLPLFPLAASAHAGHDSHIPSDHILHYLATPVHAIPLMIAAVLVSVVAWIVRREMAVYTIRCRDKR